MEGVCDAEHSLVLHNYHISMCDYMGYSVTCSFRVLPQIVREFHVEFEGELELQFEFILSPKAPINFIFNDRQEWLKIIICNFFTAHLPLKCYGLLKHHFVPTRQVCSGASECWRYSGLPCAALLKHHFVPPRQVCSGASECWRYSAALSLDCWSITSSPRDKSVLARPSVGDTVPHSHWTVEASLRPPETSLFWRVPVLVVQCHTLIGLWLRLALFTEPNKVGVFHLSPEDGIRSSFRNVF
jgi:hypothetical protein